MIPVNVNSNSPTALGQYQFDLRSTPAGSAGWATRPARAQREDFSGVQSATPSSSAADPSPKMSIEMSITDFDQRIIAGRTQRTPRAPRAPTPDEQHRATAWLTTTPRSDTSLGIPARTPASYGLPPLASRTPGSGQSAVKARKSHRPPRTPRTPRGRGTPRTPRASPAASGRQTPAQAAAGSYIIAMCEWGRQRCEVGVAIIDLQSPNVLLYQFPDNSTYNSTLMLVQQYHAREICFPQTQKDAALISAVTSEFDMIRFTALKRKYFNESDGLKLIEKLAFNSRELSVDNSHYLCLAACAALLQYIESVQFVAFLSKTLRIRMMSLEGYMKLNTATIKNLELVSNLDSKDKNAGSLYRILNLCCTPSGSRLLRRSLLQPLTDVPTLNLRLDAVEELCNESVYFSTYGALSGLADLDQAVNQLCRNSTEAKEAIAAVQATRVLKNVLLLRVALGTFQRVVDSTKDCSNMLLKTICGHLSHPQCQSLIDTIDKYVSPDAAIPTGKSSTATGQEARLVHATKEGFHDLLDLARRTYQDILKHIHSSFEQVKEEMNMPDATLSFDKGRGFFLIVSHSALQNLDGSADEVFIHRVKKHSQVHCTTEDILSLDQRRREAFGEVMLLTIRVLEDCLRVIRAHMPWLVVCSESLAMLDMLMAFAQCAANNEWVRPSFSSGLTVDKSGSSPTRRQGRVLNIKQGRHPIMELMQSEKQYIPNDVSASASDRLQIVTGPNSAGKSTYLRQLGTLCLLAQIGSFVPAASAEVCIMDQVLTRFSFEDSMEENCGTFMVEMNETAYILSNMTQDSLVLVDELGRGTSTLEGLGVAWSVAEHILKSGALCLFATHATELTDLDVIYKGVRNVSLKCSNIHGRLRYDYEIQHGASAEQQYAFTTAKRAGIDEQVLKEAERIRQEVRAHHQGRGVSNVLFHQLLRHIDHTGMKVRESVLDLPAAKKRLSAIKKHFRTVANSFDRTTMDDTSASDPGTSAAASN